MTHNFKVGDRVMVAKGVGTIVEVDSSDKEQPYRIRLDSSVVNYAYWYLSKGPI